MTATPSTHSHETLYQSDGQRDSHDPTGDSLPIVVLPGGAQRVVDSAKKLGELLAATGRMFSRGGAVVKLVKDDESSEQRLEVLRPVEMPAVFENFATLKKIVSRKDGVKQEATTCNEQTAKLLLHTDEFRKALPPIKVVTSCPVLIERGGQLVLVCDYDRESGILAAGESVRDAPLDDARQLLCELLDDFQFATSGDRSRALAAMITPAIVFGDLLQGRAPVDLSEADHSQTGKGYRNKITAALYRERVKTVTQRRGGVGGLDESFDAAVVSGAPFVALDNMRGKVDSPSIESFMTEDIYLTRVPYCASVPINPRRTIIMLTSNKAELTRDLANRSSCVRLLKQPPGYDFPEHPEGDLLEHVRANQPLYLGAVFAIVRAWHEAGKPSANESRHDFRRWAGVLDWIVQNLLGVAPLMDGHHETQLRMTNPALNWLRDVALAIENSCKLDLCLRAHQILDIIDAAGLDIPGVGEGNNLENEATRNKALLGIGKRMAKCFEQSSDHVEIDHFVVERRITPDEDGRDRKEYVVRIADSPTSQRDPPFPASPHDTPTFNAPLSIEPPTNGDRSKCLEPRGVRGAMRGCGEQQDSIESNLFPPDCEAEEWGEI